jgi:hypothetical protein
MAAAKLDCFAARAMTVGPALVGLVVDGQDRHLGKPIIVISGSPIDKATHFQTGLAIRSVPIEENRFE